MCNSINQKSKFEGSVTASNWWKDTSFTLIRVLHLYGFYTGFTLILRDGLFVLHKMIFEIFFILGLFIFEFFDIF